MDQNLIYAKTPTGDEAVRQSTRVVQRNLRMVLVQVDGKMSVAELAAKVGNATLVEGALQELEQGGYIAPVLEAASVWEESKKAAQQVTATSPASQFSTFGPKSLQSDFSTTRNRDVPNVFSTFGKPIPDTDEVEREAKPGLKERLGNAFEKMESRGDKEERMPFQFRPALLLWGLLLIMVVGGGSIVLYPYDSYEPELEAALGRALRAPVKVGSVSLGLQPKPGLYLRNVGIGEGQESRIEEIRLPSPFALFGAGRKTLNGLELNGIHLSADRVAALAAGNGESPRTDVGFIIGQVTLKQMTVAARDIALPKLGGEAYFKPTGGLDRLAVQSEDRTLRIDAQPTAMGVALTIEGLAWKPLADRPFVFESMQAKALLQKGKLVVQDIDTTFMGGVLRGSWLLDWNSGLVMAGDASLVRLSMRQVLDGFGVPLKLEGELAGGLRLRSSGVDWRGLWNNVEASLDADISRGTLQGIDLGEAARRPGQAVRNGSTKFDSLKGVLRLNAKLLTGSEVLLSAGLLTADGAFVASRAGGVEGNFVVNIRSSVSSLRTPVRIGGQLPALTAEAGR